MMRKRWEGGLGASVVIVGRGDGGGGEYSLGGSGEIVRLGVSIAVGLAVEWRERGAGVG